MILGDSSVITSQPTSTAPSPAANSTSASITKVPDVTVGAFAKLTDVEFAAGDGAVDVGCDVITEESPDITIRE